MLRRRCACSWSTTTPRARDILIGWRTRHRRVQPGGDHAGDGAGMALASARGTRPPYDAACSSTGRCPAWTASRRAPVRALPALHGAAALVMVTAFGRDERAAAGASGWHRRRAGEAGDAVDAARRAGAACSAREPTGERDARRERAGVDAAAAPARACCWSRTTTSTRRSRSSCCKTPASWSTWRQRPRGARRGCERERVRRWC